MWTEAHAKGRGLWRSSLLVLAVASGACGSDAPADKTDDTVLYEIVDTGPPPAADVVEIEADAEPIRPDLTWPVGQEGPYRAGYRIVDVTYAPPAVAEPRGLRISVWYPTEDTTGELAVYFDLFAQPDVFVDASLAAPADGERYPVLAYSHDHKSHPGDAPALVRHFATHGWVVVAPEHRLDTLDDALLPTGTSMFFLRSLDVSAALDLIADPKTGDVLGGLLAIDEVVVAGYGFGGYAALGLAGSTFDTDRIIEDCAIGRGPGGECTSDEINMFSQGVADERVVAAIAMAPNHFELFGEAGLQAVLPPVLLLTGDADEVAPDAAQGDAFWAALASGEARRVDVAGGCHALFGGGSCDGVSGAEGERIVNTYGLAFARRHALEDASVAAVLDGAETVSDKVSLHHK